MTTRSSATRIRRASANGVIGVLAHGAGFVCIGAIAGLTWAAALRAYMVALAGPISAFSWWGTFGAILAPGAVSGALLALAWLRARAGRPSMWFAFAPAPMVLVPLLEPGALGALLTSGLGGGAAGVVATVLIGGVTLGQRGHLWVRVAFGAVWCALLAGFAMTPALVAGLPLTSPEGAWLTVLVTGLLILLSVACVAPFLRRDREDDARSTD